MCDFNHPHVLGLVGICMDENNSPYLILPYMDNGDLKHFLKLKRDSATNLTDSKYPEVSLGHQRRNHSLEESWRKCESEKHRASTVDNFELLTLLPLSFLRTPPPPPPTPPHTHTLPPSSTYPLPSPFLLLH